MNRHQKRTNRATVRPRLIWAGVLLAIAAMVVIGVGMIVASNWLIVAGVAALAIGLVDSWVGGIANDGRRGHAFGAEIDAIREGGEQPSPMTPDNQGSDV